MADLHTAAVANNPRMLLKAQGDYWVGLEHRRRYHVSVPEPWLCFTSGMVFGGAVGRLFSAVGRASSVRVECFSKPLAQQPLCPRAAE